MKNKHLCFGGLVSSLPVEDPILWLEVIVAAEGILEFTGCMNEDSEEKEIFIFAINLNSSYCRPTKTFSYMWIWKNLCGCVYKQTSLNCFLAFLVFFRKFDNCDSKNE